MIKICVAIIVICILALIRNAYVYRMGEHINNMIYEYHIYTIDNVNTTEAMNAYRLIDAWEDYEQFNYVKVFFKFWIWDWRKMIPEDLVEKIEPFE